MANHQSPGPRPPIFAGDPYFPDLPTVQDQIPVAEDVPISDRENDMEEEPKEDPKEENQEMEIVSDEVTNDISPNRSHVKMFDAASNALQEYPFLTPRTK